MTTDKKMGRKKLDKEKKGGKGKIVHTFLLKKCLTIFLSTDQTHFTFYF